ncbi:MAG: cytochrome c oxidase accessory protein CcoG [Bacteroidota bacterium]
MSQLPPHETYRDHLSTVDGSGSRVWLYPKKPSGKFYRWRSYLSYFLLLLLFGLPFVKVHGDPILLFNVLEGRFIIFGIVFTPQDLHLFALAMITLMLFVVLFTVVFGRLFCGWVCPQTIFMEMVFRKIEYWIEGDANQQRRLNRGPWTATKVRKKALKHFLFFAIAVLIVHAFLSYLIGVDEVGKIISEPIHQHLGGFVAMLVFSGLFYGVFAFFREQVCLAVCPYGRLQDVLLVKDSIVVIYDWVRGEPRGKMKKKRRAPRPAALAGATIPYSDGYTASDVISVPKLGDCVDCRLCVQVCPTGIDIRNGTQLECVNCTACMDACDGVMRKINRAEGLIRQDSEHGIKKGQQKIVTPRVLAYSVVLGLLLVFQVLLFSTRSEVETLILRTPGMLYQEVDEQHLSNLYNYQLINKTNLTIQDLELRLQADYGRIELVGNIPDIPKQELSEGAFFIILPRAQLTGRKTRLAIEVYAGGQLIDRVKTNFLGPAH